MPLSAREGLLRIARAAGLAIVENDIYGALRYRGEALPTLKQLDETGQVIQIRSFSKIAFPGLRTGWVVAPRAVAARLAALKQITDLHSDQLSQAVLHRFAASGRLRKHTRQTLARGAERLNAVLAACAAHLPEEATFTRPEGGMNLWVRLPERLDASALAVKAAAEGVSYLPGRYFAVSRVEASALRLSFAGLEPAQIRHGVAVLGKVFQRELERNRAERHAVLAPAIV
jgi:2-aminoadipate transaminase